MGGIKERGRGITEKLEDTVSLDLEGTNVIG